MNGIPQGSLLGSKLDSLLFNGLLSANRQGEVYLSAGDAIVY